MVFLLLLSVLLILGCERESEPTPRVSVKELVGMKGCPHCHDMRRQLLGPSFLDISRRYSEEEEIVKSIIEGSRGKWGKNAMPPQKLTEEEARLIARWILNLKKELE
jgi:cytochrome c